MSTEEFIVQPSSTKPLLHDEEVRLFLREAPKKHARGRSFMRGVVVLAVSSVLFYVLMFGEALWYSLTTPSPVVTAQQIEKAVALPSANPEPSLAPKPTPTIPENTLYYADTQISIPLTWDVGLDPDESNEGLRKGGIHIKGTAKPGQKGMASVSCHSSGFFWDSNPYKNACATLYKAKAEQIISVNYQNTEYKYKVFKIYEVKPEDINILEDHTTSGLRIITCTPIGTNWRRLVVEAVQIEPNPSTNTDFTGATFTGQLPKDR